MRSPLLAAGLIACAAAMLVAPAGAQAPISFAKATEGLERRDGYVPLYWNAAKGKLYLEVTRPGEDFLYLTSLVTGLGIAGLDLDRSMLGDEYIARFERAGGRMHLVLQHPRFRAGATTNAALARSVQESFPTSTIASLEIVAEEAGRVLVDATSAFLTDAINVRGELRDAGEGTFNLDRERSSVYAERTRAFPLNTEIEVSLTLVSDAPGPRVRAHTPDPRAITIRQHHSLVRLPEAGYRPRRFDPRVGVNAISFHDFSRGFAEDYSTRYAVRHRLVKKNPGAAMSEPVKPIVYYMDTGIPEPYRSALKDGFAWWNKTFEAAGFRNAFRVEDMPADMDPMDARYNVVSWVHRTQPSSSFGNSFIDPRTGEIIKGSLRMDSHRSLVDFNIFAGAVSADAAPVEAIDDRWLTSLDTLTAGELFTMSRRRQHAAHEMGHTLGLAHNFIASSYGSRASAMAYPAPLIKLTNGQIDLSDAYRPGLGAYDTLAIRYGYTEFPAADEDAGLRAIAEEGMRKGYRFITNPDEGLAGSYPEGTTWINGEDAVEELARVVKVRKALIDRFDERAIEVGQPLSMLNRRFVSVYLHHRFTLDAALKAVGGMEYRYGLRGDSIPSTTIIPAARQRRALELVLDAVQPEQLAIPERVLALMTPRPFGFYELEPREFRSAAAPAFDQLGVARTLATSAVRGLLVPARAARMVAFAERDAQSPSLVEVVNRMIARTWVTPTPARNAGLKRVAERVVLDELLRLAIDPAATPEVRAGAEWGVRQIATIAKARAGGSRDDAAHRALAAADGERFLSRRDAPTARPEPIPAPPGTPIGGAERP